MASLRVLLTPAQHDETVSAFRLETAYMYVPINYSANIILLFVSSSVTRS